MIILPIRVSICSDKRNSDFLFRLVLHWNVVEHWYGKYESGFGYF